MLCYIRTVPVTELSNSINLVGEKNGMGAGVVGVNNGGGRSWMFRGEIPSFYTPNSTSATQRQSDFICATLREYDTCVG